MRKKLAVLSYLLVVILFFNACGSPITYVRAPDRQPNTKWVSEDGNIVFTIPDNEALKPGKIYTENGVIDVYLRFDTGVEVILYSEATDDGKRNAYELWKCSYRSKKRFVATVHKTTFFEIGQKIAFYRVDEEE